MKQRMTLGQVALILATWSAPKAWADQFHYNNITVGTRAVGMGGAFTGVADDASGVFYNPAGLAFALSNDISGSANAFYQKSATYKNTLCGDDFTETSGGSIPSFFGGLQKLDRYVEGLVFAFGAYSTDSDLKDQDTALKNRVSGCNGAQIESYHRASNARANTYYAGAAVGKRVGSSLAWGFGLSYVNVDELVQEYQDFKQATSIPLATGTIPGWNYYSGNIRQHLEVYGVQPVVGVQAALPGGVAVGITLKHPIVASQTLQVDAESQSNLLSNDQKAASDASGGRSSSIQASKSNSHAKSKNPIGELPDEVRAGVAWFASPTLLLTLDLIHHPAVTTAEVVKDDEGNSLFGSRPIFAKEAVTDFAMGGEYYLVPAIPLRFGVFSNYDARPKVQKVDPTKYNVATVCSYQASHDQYCDQPDHIDYLGETLFIAWVQPNSQIAAGFVLQQGKGQAQKVGADYHVQDVVASSYTFAFSATHNL